MGLAVTCAKKSSTAAAGAECVAACLSAMQSSASLFPPGNAALLQFVGVSLDLCKRLAFESVQVTVHARAAQTAALPTLSSTRPGYVSATTDYRYNSF